MFILVEWIVDENVVGLGVDIVCVIIGVIVVFFFGLILFCLGLIFGLIFGFFFLIMDGVVVGSCMWIGGFFFLKLGIKKGVLVFFVNFL